MAKLYVTEFVAGGRSYGNVPVADAGGWVENGNSPLTISNTASFASTFAKTTTLIRVSTDTICSVFVTLAATGGTATTSNARLPANAIEYWQVHNGQTLSVILNT
jgi:hypothetical protein